MAKVIRKELEAKLAALGGAEWDSMSEGSLSGDESGAQLDGELKPPPLPIRAHKTKKGARKEKEVEASVVPVGPAGEPSGVVYVGHIPHGFYEEAMNGFFKQFGDVIRVRVSRSKKSARCKGYAYVEFSSPEVAGIVAETMNGYYLFDKQLVCRVLRFEEVHPNLFDGAGVKFRKVNWHGLYREKYNADRTPAKDERHVAKLVKKDEAKRAKLAALGIEYDFPGFLASLNDRQVEAGPFQGKKKRKDEGEQDSAPSRKRRTASGDAAVPAPAAQPDTTTPASPSPSPSSSNKPKTKGTDADAKASARKRGDSSPPVNAKAKANSKSKAKSSGKGTTPSAKKSKPSKVVESPSAPTPPPPSTTGVSPGRKRAAKTPAQKKRKPSAGEEGAAGNVATPLRTGATAAEEMVAGGTAKGSVSRKGHKTPLPGGAKSGVVGSEGGKGKSPKSGSRKRSSQQAQDGEEGGAEEGVGSGKARRTKRAKA